jgi:hypothetical protein
VIRYHDDARRLLKRLDLIMLIALAAIVTNRKRLPPVNEYGHPLRPLRVRAWHRLRYWGIPISQYEMPPCPHDREHR